MKVLRTRITLNDRYSTKIDILFTRLIVNDRYGMFKEDKVHLTRLIVNDRYLTKIEVPRTRLIVNDKYLTKIFVLTRLKVNDRRQQRSRFSSPD